MEVILSYVPARTHATIEVALFSETVSEGWRSLSQNRPKRAVFLRGFRRIPRPWDIFSSDVNFILHLNSFWVKNDMS